MARQSSKQRNAEVAAIIQSAVYGWEIPMMSISAIYKAGERAAGDVGPIDAGAVRLAVTAALEVHATRVMPPCPHEATLQVSVGSLPARQCEACDAIIAEVQ